jgi:hypothetical protein
MLFQHSFNCNISLIHYFSHNDIAEILLHFGVKHKSINQPIIFTIPTGDHTVDSIPCSCILWFTTHQEKLIFWKNKIS